MADEQNGNEAQYIASRYDGLAVGPKLAYTYETQSSVPYDGTNKLARLLSPFTLRLVVPEALVEGSGVSSVDVNLLGRATKAASDLTSKANSIRSAIGIPQVTGTNNASSNLTSLQSTLSSGQALLTTLGNTERAVVTDLVTVADIQYQVEKMLQTPPLTLFVNPNTLTINRSSVQQFSNRTRYGKVFERWGQAQVTLSISGSTGAFAAGNPTGTAGVVQSTAGFAGITNSENDVASGVQFASKRDSAAFQQLMSLFHIYQNNGYIYDTVGGSEAHLFIGSVAIDYDQMTYIGNIDSFEYGYSDESPHRIEWSMEFTVSRTYDLAEEPVVVTPQSTPTPGIGGLSDAELLRMSAGVPSQNSITVGSVPVTTQTGTVLGDVDINVSGTEQFQTGAGQTPLDVVGAYFTPTGLLG
tara:strand:+ start:1315 stop:2553 length:1239 start_codon:yes stop_codon:yes gene_type:complete